MNKRVEHITLGGDTAFRDFAGIEPQTIAHFRDFQFTNDTRTIKVKRTPFSVMTTAMPEGAFFDIMIEEQTLFYNLCCFDGKFTQNLLPTIFEIHKQSDLGEPRLPVLDQWLYSVPYVVAGIDAHLYMIAGEIELYIYHALFLGQKSSLSK